MALPTIVWNGNTLTLNRRASAWVHSVVTDVTKRTSIDGHHRFHHRRYLWHVNLILKAIPKDTEVALINWWSWASRGGYFAVARDGGKTLNTTLDADAASGQKVVPLTSTTGVVSGDLMLLTDAERTIFEVVEVDTVSAGVSITAKANLTNTFYSGDTCRHLYYMPRVVATDPDYPVKTDGEGSTNGLDLNVTLEEDLA